MSEPIDFLFCFQTLPKFGTAQRDEWTKRSPQVCFNIHNSANLACRAFNIGCYTQDTNKVIVWNFLNRLKEVGRF